MRDQKKQQQGRVCGFDGCNRECRSRGYCIAHYNRLRESGELPRLALTVEQRFWTKVDRSGDCWLWTAGTKIVRSRGNAEYGAFWNGRTTIYAHRYAYDLAYEDLDPNLQVDHTCWNTLCVRSAHLRQVTQKQNQENRRGAAGQSASGIRGVHKGHGSRWVASVTHDGKNYRTSHDTIEEAAMAVRERRLALYTHNVADRDVAA